MPNCFQLSRKDSPVFTPVAFQEIDEEMCKAFNVPCDPKFYFRSWYHTVGMALAMGYDWQAIKDKDFADVEVVDWLAERYVSNAFYMPK